VAPKSIKEMSEDVDRMIKEREESEKAVEQ
jgi:hypothetical protein